MGERQIWPKVDDPGSFSLLAAPYATVTPVLTCVPRLDVYLAYGGVLCKLGPVTLRPCWLDVSLEESQSGEFV